jgi:hypothetical protein
MDVILPISTHRYGGNERFTDDQIIELRKELQAGINQCFGPNYNAAAVTAK